MTPVAIALGSNLGDRPGHLTFAIGRLRSHLADLRVSSFIETTPVGVGPQPDFLNGAASGLFRGTPQELLDILLAIEADAGRVRPHPGAARTLDLDLILFGVVILNQPGLVVPHPRFRERVFVLQPLAEVAPDMVDPVTGLTVKELLGRLQRTRSATRGFPS